MQTGCIRQYDDFDGAQDVASDYRAVDGELGDTWGDDGVPASVDPDVPVSDVEVVDQVEPSDMQSDVDTDLSASKDTTDIIGPDDMVDTKDVCVPDCEGKECGNDGCGGACGTCPAWFECQGGICVCVSNCAGKNCGPDGCGGLCGLCAYGQVCTIGGQCQNDICNLNCVMLDGGFKQCGPDGCGGYCGFCMGSSLCGADGLCYEGTCEGSCDGKQCGLDGCGVVCGYCDDEELCTDDGQCVPHPCGGVGVDGLCTEMYTLQKCVNLEVVETNCLSIQDHMCGWSENLGEYDCIPEVPCEPSCLDVEGQTKECGTDGCWGFCGVCPNGWGCMGGSCRPGPGAECSWIDSTAGACFDHEWWFCSGGKLFGYDCFANELKTCGYSFEFNFGQGGFGCVPNICIPACEEMECGDDGCGGLCSCPAAHPNCVEGICKCTPFSCSDGTYCSGGVCVQCNVDAHCGPDCLSCPAMGQFCSTDGTHCLDCDESHVCPANKQCVDELCVDCQAQGCQGDASPVGETCASAKVIGRIAAVSGYSTTGDTENDGNNDDLPSFGGPDCWDAKFDNFFRIWLVQGDLVTIVADPGPADFNMSLKLYQGIACHDDWENEFVVCEWQENGGASETIVHTASQDGWFTIVVDGAAFSYDEYDWGAYDLYVSLNCADAGCCCLVEVSDPNG